jgi:two-component system, NarL family, nitrate/nitrite response regulator NarL
MTAQTLTLIDDRSSDTDLPSTSLTPAIPTALLCDSSLLHTRLQHLLRDTPFAIAEAASVTVMSR